MGNTQRAIRALIAASTLIGVLASAGGAAALDPGVMRRPPTAAELATLTSISDMPPTFYEFLASPDGTTWPAGNPAGLTPPINVQRRAWAIDITFNAAECDERFLVSASTDWTLVGPDRGLGDNVALIVLNGSPGVGAGVVSPGPEIGATANQSISFPVTGEELRNGVTIFQISDTVELTSSGAPADLSMGYQSTPLAVGLMLESSTCATPEPVPTATTTPAAPGQAPVPAETEMLANTGSELLVLTVIGLSLLVVGSAALMAPAPRRRHR